MKKLEDWRTNLGRHILLKIKTPKQWGSSDCVQWTFSCIEIITGENPFKHTFETYSDVRGALKCLKSENCTSLKELCFKYFGEEKHIAQAKAGDVVLADLSMFGESLTSPDQFEVAVGICNGHLSYFVTETGLISIQTLSLLSCYHY